MSLGIKLLLFGGGKKFGFGRSGAVWQVPRVDSQVETFSFGTKSTEFSLFVFKLDD